MRVAFYSKYIFFNKIVKKTKKFISKERLSNMTNNKYKNVIYISREKLLANIENVKNFYKAVIELKDEEIADLKAELDYLREKYK